MAEEKSLLGIENTLEAGLRPLADPRVEEEGRRT